MIPKNTWVSWRLTIEQVQLKDKIKKNISQENAKTTRDKTLQEKPHQRNKYLGFAPR